MLQRVSGMAATDERRSAAIISLVWFKEGNGPIRIHVYYVPLIFPNSLVSIKSNSLYLLNLYFLWNPTYCRVILIKIITWHHRCMPGDRQANSSKSLPTWLHLWPSWMNDWSLFVYLSLFLVYIITFTNMNEWILWLSLIGEYITWLNIIIFKKKCWSHSTSCLRKKERKKQEGLFPFCKCIFTD